MVHAYYSHQSADAIMKKKCLIKNRKQTNNHMFLNSQKGEIQTIPTLNTRLADLFCLQNALEKDQHQIVRHGSRKIYYYPPTFIMWPVCTF